MPIYEYEHVAPFQKNCAERFELYQQFADEALIVCPQCAGVVRRIISTPAIHGKGTAKDSLSNKNLAAKGFTKYVKAGDGCYEKAAGQGPDVIRR